MPNRDNWLEADEHFDIEPVNIAGQELLSFRANLPVYMGDIETGYLTPDEASRLATRLMLAAGGAKARQMLARSGAERIDTSMDP
jgi:hypothetical protein